MPAFPSVSPSVAAAPASVYSTLVGRAAASGHAVVPMHIGDTWLEAPEGCRMEDLHVAHVDGLHRYAPVQGLPALLDAIAARVERAQGVRTPPTDVLVTAGGTGGFGAVLGAVCSPGDEVLVCAPYWPLITGIVRGAHATPVVVPVLGLEADAAAFVAALDAACGARTVALYLNSPNNPSGAVYSPEVLQGVVELARRRGLWLLADECYEAHVYAGQHTPLRSLAPERTFSVHSFSKAFGMAGNRCGYVVSPRDLTEHLRKVSLHTFYATPTSAQHAALRALAGPGDAFAAQARVQYAALAEEVARALGVGVPASGTFVFVDVAEPLRRLGLTLVQLLERLADLGVLVAPGPSCGPFPTHVRVCFTACPPEQTRRGVRLIARVLDGGEGTP